MAQEFSLCGSRYHNCRRPAPLGCDERLSQVGHLDFQGVLPSAECLKLAAQSFQLGPQLFLKPLDGIVHGGECSRLPSEES